MEKSTHKVEVVKVHPTKHPDADRLAVALVYGYSVCIGINDFEDGDLGIYIPPDSIVPAIEQFRFIWEARGFVTTADPGRSQTGLEINSEVPEKYRRIKAKTIRGVISEGLLMPLLSFPTIAGESQHYPGLAVVKEGDDVATLLGITHYDPSQDSTLGGDNEAAPIVKPRKRRYPRTLRGWFRFLLSKIMFWKKPVKQEEETSLAVPVYDIDAWQRYKHLLITGEDVWITEKLHGANSRYTFRDGRMYVGSHHTWKRESDISIWWQCLRQNPWIEDFCKSYEGFVLYGELLPMKGHKLQYGLKSGNLTLSAFDVLDNNSHWLSLNELNELQWAYRYPSKEHSEGFVTRGILAGRHWAPTIAVVSYDPEDVRKTASGPSIYPGASHIREGIVIKPVVERRDARFGRVILKVVSVEYLASKQSDDSIAAAAS